MNTKKFLYLFSLLLIIIGVALEPSLSLFSNMTNLIIGKDGLITDYFIKGSQGAAFLNAGLIGLVSTKLLSIAKSEYNGIDFAAVMLAIGFALFGKNIFNIWTIIIGGILYSKINKVPYKNVIPISLFATSLAPLTTEILFVFEGSLALRIFLFLLTGISTGYLINVVAPHVKVIHKGYNLYNVGFAIGLMGTVYVSLLRSFGYEIASHLVWDTNKNIHLYILFAIIFILIGIYGVFQDQGFNNYLSLLKTTGKGNDYFKEYNIYTVLINIAGLGLLTLLVTYFLDIPMNGPILGGVITIIGFAAAGKHPRNILPIFIGVILGGFTKTWNVTDPSVALTMMFLTGLAPISGSFGFLAGIIFTYINSSVALNTGVLHGGLNLYNTGFSIGITCAVLVPIFEYVLKNKKI